MPGVRVQRTGGHTAHHQIVWIDSGTSSACYVADLMPTTAHLPDAWGSGFDLYPMDTMTAKQTFVDTAVSKESLIFFEHDPAIHAGYLITAQGQRQLRPTP
jgi:glyoxylase-like metal-dependent hydrolase (beta-lactamase superfamily II)